MLARTVSTLATDVQFHAGEAKSLGQLGRWRWRQVQANDIAALGTAEMHVLPVFAIGPRQRETENPTRIGGLMGQANLGEPIEYPVQGHSVHFRERFLTQQGLNVAVAERHAGCLE